MTARSALAAISGCCSRAHVFAGGKLLEGCGGLALFLVCACVRFIFFGGGAHRVVQLPISALFRLPSFACSCRVCHVCSCASGRRRATFFLGLLAAPAPFLALAGLSCRRRRRSISRARALCRCPCACAFVVVGRRLPLRHGGSRDLCLPGRDCPVDELDHQHLLLQQGDLPARAHLQRLRCPRQDSLPLPYRRHHHGGREGSAH